MRSAIARSNYRMILLKRVSALKMWPYINGFNSRCKPECLPIKSLQSSSTTSATKNSTSLHSRESKKQFKSAWKITLHTAKQQISEDYIRRIENRTNRKPWHYPKALRD